MNDPLTCSTTLALSDLLLFSNPHLISEAEALPPAFCSGSIGTSKVVPRDRDSCFVLVKQMLSVSLPRMPHGGDSTGNDDLAYR